MFEKLKSRIADIERDTEQLKSELAEVKQTLARVFGENDGLRKENDRLIKMVAPAYPRVRRHDWPDSLITTPANVPAGTPDSPQARV
jgi:regulator of replication initiation timing